ncbi:Sec20-domain-containing protein [Pilobolus umbonatus]|nr:Sec20-domain-containing protein [Pilobolus umbonatus]
MSTVFENRFRSLSKLLAECQRQIEKLHQIDSLTVEKEVVELIKTNIRQLEQEITNIRQLSEEEDKESSRLVILNRLKEYEHQFKNLQVISRQSILQAKKRIEEEDKKNREELFGIGRRINSRITEQYELKQRGRLRSKEDENLLSASTNVTEALRRTSMLMQQELEKSSYSASMLAESSQTLSSTYTEYQNLDSLIQLSKRMITQLEDSDWFDRILLFIGLMLFSVVVIYIIKKRTWDVGISWLSWIKGSHQPKMVDPSSLIKTHGMIPTMTTTTMTTTTMTTTTMTTTTMVRSVYPVIRNEL